MKVMVENKKARLEFTILDTFEAGIVLEGGEVKMLRLNRGSLVSAHVRVLNGKAVLLNAQIPPYPYMRQERVRSKTYAHIIAAQTEILKLQESQGNKRA
jgi:SsrA-binding protein